MDRDDPRTSTDGELLVDDPRDAAWKDAYEAALPPPGFADRVLAAREREAPKPRFALRAPVFVASGLAAGLALAVVGDALHVPASGHFPTVESPENERIPTTLALGDDVSATVKDGARLSFDVDVLGRVAVTQDAGLAFYRVTPGTDVVVTTPLGSAHVQGTCFTVDVRARPSTFDPSKHQERDPMLTEQNPGRASFAKGALTGATLAAALVYVTVHEGEVVVSSSEGTALLVPGDRATLASGGPPRVATTDDTLKAIIDERDALRRSVDDLDQQLGTMMKAVANGSDPLVAENARLKERLARSEDTVRAFEHAEAEKAGKAFPWPKDVPEIFREEGVKKAISDAIAAAGIQGELTGIDCSEYPCVAFGELVVDGNKDESARAVDKFTGALDRTYPEDGVSRMEGIWAKSEKTPDGSPRTKSHFTIGVFPDEGTSEEEQKAIADRLRFRGQQYMESVLSP